MGLLKFTFENAKLKGIWHFSLPSGHTCPGAESCKTFADKITGKIMDAQKAVDGVIFRCYAAMDEARRPNVRKTRWENFDLLKAAKTTTPTKITSITRLLGLVLAFALAPGPWVSAPIEGVRGNYSLSLSGQCC